MKGLLHQTWQLLGGMVFVLVSVLPVTGQDIDPDQLDFTLQSSSKRIAQNDIAVFKISLENNSQQVVDFNASSLDITAGFVEFLVKKPGDTSYQKLTFKKPRGWRLGSSASAGPGERLIHYYILHKYEVLEEVEREGFLGSAIKIKDRVLITSKPGIYHFKLAIQEEEVNGPVYSNTIKLRVRKDRTVSRKVLERYSKMLHFNSVFGLNHTWYNYEHEPEEKLEYLTKIRKALGPSNLKRIFLWFETTFKYEVGKIEFGTVQENLKSLRKSMGQITYEAALHRLGYLLEGMQEYKKAYKTWKKLVKFNPKYSKYEAERDYMKKLMKAEDD